MTPVLLCMILFLLNLTSYESRLEYNKYCLLNETFDEQKCTDIETNLEDDIDGINIYDYLRECKIPKNLKGELSTSSKYYKYAPWAFKKFKTTNEKIN